MKPEYPVLFAKASIYIAAPIIFFVTVFFVTQSFRVPTKDLYPFLITSFGITITLSGVCFTMAPNKNDELTIRYAGEKFLHSSLLLIQSLIIIYAKENFLALSLFNTHTTTKIILLGLFSGVFSLIFPMAAFTWFWGFVELNKDLWGKWKTRIEDMRNEELEKQEKG